MRAQVDGARSCHAHNEAWSSATHDVCPTHRCARAQHLGWWEDNTRMLRRCVSLASKRVVSDRTQGKVRPLLGGCYVHGP